MDQSAQDVSASLLTAHNPGAIAVIALLGPSRSILRSLTGCGDWSPGAIRLVSLAGIDEGLVAHLSDDMVLLMPHGGPRVVQRLLEELERRDVAIVSSDEVPPRGLYPEAADEIEAFMLATLARAASPLAINPLLAQTTIWRARPHITNDDRARSARLNRLIDPPLIVLAGPPNVGKSTLSNALAGRPVSIAIDMPGTTRDYTAVRLDLGGLVADWCDTPGLRDTDDLIERNAMALASGLFARADLLLAMTDLEHDWPRLPREPDLRISSKSDLGVRDDADIAISAASGEALAELVQIVRRALVPDDDLLYALSRPWLFHESLEMSIPNGPHHDA